MLGCGPLERLDGVREVLLLHIALRQDERLAWNVVVEVQADALEQLHSEARRISS